MASTDRKKEERSSSNADHHPKQYHHHEDRLSRTWRSLGSYLLTATSKSEKAAKEANKAILKDIDESVVNFLKTRVEWGRLVSYLEAKLQGKAKEIETMQHYVRSQPTIGIRRKRKRLEEAEKEESAKKPATEPAIESNQAPPRQEATSAHVSPDP